MAMMLDFLAKLIADGDLRRTAEMQELRSTLDTFKPELDEIRATFKTWRPAMESKVGDLGSAVRDLRRKVDHIAKGIGARTLGSA
jgi:hypothetical protein